MITDVSILRGELGEVVVPVDSCYNDFRVAGSGEVTNESCGKFKGAYGCNRVELHNHVGLDGVNYAGKVYEEGVYEL